VQVLCWDVTERVREQDRLTHAALHDELTGLPNRVLLEQHWNRLLTEWSDEAEGPAALFCDLDGFKQVNDRHGHAAGDEALRMIAARLRGAVRGGDLVGRYGGDEFVVLLRAGHPDLPEVLLGRIRDAVQEPLAGGPLQLRTAVSVGRGCALTNPESLAAVLARADGEMYRSRRRERLA
jgi:diguanylate cyclase (GGDEF)-like protein